MLVSSATTRLLAIATIGGLSFSIWAVVCGPLWQVLYPGYQVATTLFQALPDTSISYHQIVLEQGYVNSLQMDELLDLAELELNQMSGK